MTPSFQELKEEIIAAPYLFAKEKENDLKVFISTVLEELYCPRREDDEKNGSSISPSRNLKKPPLVHALELVQKQLRSMREQKIREEEEEERGSRVCCRGIWMLHGRHVRTDCRLFINT